MIRPFPKGFSGRYEWRQQLVKGEKVNQLYSKIGDKSRQKYNMFCLFRNSRLQVVTSTIEAMKLSGCLMANGSQPELCFP